MPHDSSLFFSRCCGFDVRILFKAPKGFVTEDVKVNTEVDVRQTQQIRTHDLSVSATLKTACKHVTVLTSLGCLSVALVMIFETRQFWSMSG